MAAPTDVFPSFPEMCQRARDIERRILAIPQGQTEGEVHTSGESWIFPREYEDYTYSFMLDEAQRLERQLSLAGKPLSQSPAIQVPPIPVFAKPSNAGEEKVEKELHGFATPRYIYSEKKDDAQIAEEEQSGLPPPEPQPGEKPPAQSAAKQGAEGKKPRLLPVQIPSQPSAARLPRQEPQKQGQFEEPPRPPVPQEEAIPLPIEKEESAEEQGWGEDAPKPEKGSSEEGSQPKPRFMASSKISPRLRAIIEEKLRREEASGTGRKKEEDIEIPRAPEGEKAGAEPAEEEAPLPPEPEEAPEGKAQEEEAAKGEPKLPVPEREDWQSEDESESGAAPPTMSEPAGKEGEDEEAAAPAISKEESEGGRGQEAATEEKPLPPSSFPLLSQKEGKGEGRQKAGAGQEEKPVQFSRKIGEPLRITPLFKDDESAKKKEQSAETESQKRLARIQRIIDGLSSDKPPEEPDEPPDEGGEGKGGPGGATPSRAKKEGKAGQKKAKEQTAPATIAPKKASLQKGKKGQEGKVPLQEGEEGEGIVEMPLGKKATQKQKGIAQGKAAQQPLKKPGKKILPKKGNLPNDGEGAKPPVQSRDGVPKGKGAAQQVSAKEKLAKILGRQALPEEKEKQMPPVAGKPQEKAAAGAQRKMPRIFPGGKLTPTVSPKTYVPPARNEPLAPTAGTGRQGPKIAPEEGKQEARPDAGGEKQGQAPFPPSAELAAKTGESEPRALSSVCKRLEETELAGKAKLPPEEDELEVPAPKPDDEPPVPKPEEYGEAKDELRRRLEDFEKIETAKKEAEDYLEQYAKQNILWLYELYKMGALPREEFLAKVKEKISEASGKAASAPVESNPALANLSQQIDKKYNK